MQLTDALFRPSLVPTERPRRPDRQYIWTPSVSSWQDNALSSGPKIILIGLCPIALRNKTLACGRGKTCRARLTHGKRSPPASIARCRCRRIRARSTPTRGHTSNARCRCSSAWFTTIRSLFSTYVESLSSSLKWEQNQ